MNSAHKCLNAFLCDETASDQSFDSPSLPSNVTDYGITFESSCNQKSRSREQGSRRNRPERAQSAGGNALRFARRLEFFSSSSSTSSNVERREKSAGPSTETVQTKSYHRVYHPSLDTLELTTDSEKAIGKKSGPSESNDQCLVIPRAKTPHRISGPSRVVPESETQGRRTKSQPKKRTYNPKTVIKEIMKLQRSTSEIAS